MESNTQHGGFRFDKNQTPEFNLRIAEGMIAGATDDIYHLSHPLGRERNLLVIQCIILAGYNRKNNSVGLGRESIRRYINKVTQGLRNPDLKQIRAATTFWQKAGRIEIRDPDGGFDQHKFYLISEFLFDRNNSCSVDVVSHAKLFSEIEKEVAEERVRKLREKESAQVARTTKRTDGTKLPVNRADGMAQRPGVDRDSADTSISFDTSREAYARWMATDEASKMNLSYEHWMEWQEMRRLQYGS